MKRILLITLFVFLLAVNVLAIGISPGIRTVNYEPKLKTIGSFTVYNTEHKDMRVFLNIEGEYKEIIRIKEDYIDFTSDKESKTIEYKIKIPEYLEPGEHIIKIIAIEQEPRSIEGISIGAVLAVMTQVKVSVPIPEIYLESELHIAAEGNIISFTIPIKNLGKSDIQEVMAKIDIETLEGKIIDTIATDSAQLKVNENSELNAVWIPDVDSGLYKAGAVVAYDNEASQEERQFNVGEVHIEVLEIGVDKFKLGEIAKFNVAIQSIWNQKIDDVFGEMQIHNKNKELLAKINSPTTSIEPYKKGELEFYWDTKNIVQDRYDIKLILYYNGKTTEKDFEADVKSNKIITSKITGGAVNLKTGKLSLKKATIFLGAIVVIIGLIWIIYRSRRKKLAV